MHTYMDLYMYHCIYACITPDPNQSEPNEADQHMLKPGLSSLLEAILQSTVRTSSHHGCQCVSVNQTV